MARAYIGWESGATSTYSPTSEFVTFGTAPAIGTLFKYEVATSPALPDKMDFRIVYSIAGGSCRFNYGSTAFNLDISSGIRGTLTDRGHTFALQARQSTDSTTFTGSVKVYWLSLG